MGTSGSQHRGFRRTRARAGGVPAVGGRGGVLMPQVARSAVSALRGWSGEPQKSVEIRWNGIGVVRGVGHRHLSAKCTRGHPRKRPGSTPNPRSGSEISIDTRSMLTSLSRSVPLQRDPTKPGTGEALSVRVCPTAGMRAPSACHAVRS
jgi:hypothetical protein